MSLLEDYKVMCMACNKPITSNPLRVPVPARNNRPATEHMFHSSGIECANAPDVHYILSHKEMLRGSKIG